MKGEWRIYALVNYVIIGLENGLQLNRDQAILWTNTGPMQINLTENFNQNTKTLIQ